MELYWWGLYWWGMTPGIVGVQYFTFDWNELNAWNFRVRGVDFDDLWTIDTQTYNAPMVDWGWILGQFYRAKTITFYLTVFWNTIVDTNNAIDTLKERTRKTEWRLEINVNGTIRRCKAQRTSLDFGRKYYHLTFVPDVKITFLTLSPHREEKLMTSKNDNLTWDLTYTMHNSWTAPVYPVAYVNFWTGNAWITSVSLLYQGQTITITEAFADWDILTIDAIEKVVKKNNTPIDYDWVFTRLEPGDNVCELTFNAGATVNAQLTTSFFKTYY